MNGARPGRCPLGATLGGDVMIPRRAWFLAGLYLLVVMPLTGIASLAGNLVGLLAYACEGEPIRVEIVHTKRHSAARV